MEKGICTVANFSSLQKLNDTVLLKIKPYKVQYGDANTGRGLEMNLWITSSYLDTSINTEDFMGVPPT